MGVVGLTTGVWCERGGDETSRREGLTGHGRERRVRMLVVGVGRPSARLPSTLLPRRDRPAVEQLMLLLLVVCELEDVLLLAQLSFDLRGSDDLSNKLGTGAFLV